MHRLSGACEGHEPWMESLIVVQEKCNENWKSQAGSCSRIGMRKCLFFLLVVRTRVDVANESLRTLVRKESQKVYLKNSRVPLGKNWKKKSSECTNNFLLRGKKSRSRRKPRFYLFFWKIRHHASDLLTNPLWDDVTSKDVKEK